MSAMNPLHIPRYAEGRDSICNRVAHKCGCVTVFNLALWRSVNDSTCLQHRQEAAS